MDERLDRLEQVWAEVMRVIGERRRNRRSRKKRDLEKQREQARRLTREKRFRDRVAKDAAMEACMIVSSGGEA